MTRRGLLLLVAVTAMSVIGCSRSGTVSGSMYGLTVGGETKRGADVELILVSRSDAIGRKLGEIEAALTREMAPAKAAYEEAEQRAALPSADTSRSSLYPDLSLQAASARAASTHSVDSMVGTVKQMVEIRGRYRDQARAVLLEAKKAATRTDVNGSFEFTNVPTGQYWLFAEWAAPRMQYSQVLGSYPVTDRTDWMVPISVVAGENKVQLSSSNSGWASFSWGR